MEDISNGVKGAGNSTPKTPIAGAAVEQPAISSSAHPATPTSGFKSGTPSKINLATPATSVKSLPGLVGEGAPSTPTPVKANGVSISASAFEDSGSGLAPPAISLSPDVNGVDGVPRKRNRGLNISFVASAASSLFTPKKKPGSEPQAPAPPLRDVLKEASKELKEGGSFVAMGGKAIMERLKDKKPINITLDQVVAVS